MDSSFTAIRLYYIPFVSFELAESAAGGEESQRKV
jgi:hypothetical protein